MDDILTKLSAARTRLVLDKPFLGALVLHLPLASGDPEWCRSVATDTKTLFYNPQAIARLTLPQTQFLLAHEALHCALGHFLRRGHRHRQRWDRACDLAINHVLVNEGLQPPPGILLDQRFEGLSAEEIYPLLEEESAESTIDEHLYEQQETPGAGDDGGSAQQHQDTGAQPSGTPEPKTSGLPQALSAQEREVLGQQWKQRLAWAAQQARQAGKISAALARWVDALLQPQIPWRALLAHYMSAVARDDYSFARPPRREGDFVLPRLHSAQIDLVVVVDTSGSISDDEMCAFAGEIDALKGQVRASITLHGCDAQLAAKGPWHYQPWEPFLLPQELEGGGGTRFVPVFEWVEQQRLSPDLLIYFTDAQGEFPERAPAYPVLWLVKGKGSVPWGTRIQLN